MAPSKESQVQDVKRDSSGHNVELSASKRVKALPRLSYSDTITVLIGAQEASFTVHEEYIVRRSRFFAAACSKGWKENVEKVVRLPEVYYRETFEAYLHWIYHSEIAAFPPNPEVAVQDKKSAYNRDYVESAKLYVLAEMLQDVGCKNLVVDHMIDIYETDKTLTGVNTGRYIFENTPEGSPARNLCVAIIVARVRAGWFKEHVSKLPSDMVCMIAVELMSATKRSSGHRPTFDTKNRTPYYESDSKADM